ncbi:hypothetical protein BAT_1120 [Bacillus pumilus ATCC 7061]|nr:hypothetical protein BAT_1120 [Bacillus pumilus ATCC 7061]
MVPRDKYLVLMIQDKDGVFFIVHFFHTNVQMFHVKHHIHFFK